MRTTTLVGLLAVGCTVPSAHERQTLTEPSEWETADFAHLRGISLSDARQRLDWQVLAPALQEYAAAEMGDDFAGVWIDPSDGDRVKVGVTRDQDRPAASRAIERAGLHEGVDHVVVRYSMAQLAEARQWIAAELHRVNHGAEETLKVSLRPNHNAVGLDLPRDGQLTAEQRQLVDNAMALYGDRIALGTFSGKTKTNACHYPNCDSPLRGGIDVNLPIPNTNPLQAEECTGAFIAKSKVDSKLYQFTAGHCTVDPNNNFNPSTWFARTSNNGIREIGPTHHGIWGPPGDEAIIEITDVATWNPQNMVMVTNGPGHDGAAGTTANSTYAITATGWSVVGQRICVTGASKGASNCGIVTDLDVSYDAGPVDVDGAAEADYCAVEGDSGAPLYAAHTAFGLHSAQNSDCDCLYQGIRQAEADMNVTVLTAPR